MVSYCCEVWAAGTNSWRPYLEKGASIEEAEMVEGTLWEWEGEEWGERTFWGWKEINPNGNSACWDAVPPFPDPALPCLSSDLAKKIAGVCVRKPIDCQIAYRGISKKNILLLSSMLFGIPPLLTAYTPSAQLHVKRQWEIGLRYSRSILPKCCANGIHVLLTCTI